MALLEELLGTDQFDSVEDKLNAIVSMLNDKLSGGSTGQWVVKASNDDFDFEFITFDPDTKADVLGAWTNLTMGTAAGSISSSPAPSWVKDAFGFVHLRGRYFVAYNDTGEHFTMPMGVRPAYDVAFVKGISSAATNYTPTPLNIEASSGEAEMFVPPSVTSGNILFNLDGISFYVGV